MKERTNISMDSETMAKLRELAAAQHVSVSQWVVSKVWEEAQKDDISKRLAAEIISKAATIEVK